MKIQSKNQLPIILTIVFVILLSMPRELVFAQQKQEFDVGFLVTISYAQSISKDINGRDFSLPGMGAGFYFKGSQWLFDVNYWAMTSEYTGTYSLQGGGTTIESKKEKWFMGMFRYRQRIFPFLYLSLGGGFYEGSMDYIYSVSVYNGRSGYSTTSHLCWSVGLDVPIGSKFMLGGQWISIGDDWMYNTPDSGSKGISIQVTYLFSLM